MLFHISATKYMAKYMKYTCDIYDNMYEAHMSGRVWLSI